MVEQGCSIYHSNSRMEDDQNDDAYSKTFEEKKYSDDQHKTYRNCKKCNAILIETPINECKFCLDDISHRNIKQKKCGKCGWKENHAITCHECQPVYDKESGYITSDSKRRRVYFTDESKHEMNEQMDSDGNEDKEEKNQHSDVKCKGSLYNVPILKCFECGDDISSTKIIQKNCTDYDWDNYDELCSSCYDSYCDPPNCDGNTQSIDGNSKDEGFDIGRMSYQRPLCESCSRPMRLQIAGDELSTFYRCDDAQCTGPWIEQNEQYFDCEQCDYMVCNSCGTGTRKSTYNPNKSGKIRALLHGHLVKHKSRNNAKYSRSIINHRLDDGDNHNHDMQIAMKMSYLQSRIAELYKVKLQITSLFEIKGHKDFKLQRKKEQATIMETVDMLKDMKKLNVVYYNRYCKENEWVQPLLDTFDNDLFKNQWNAFESV